jgi:hypothetical protein
MIDVRPFNTLGGANHGWLNAKHHFSFANYYDPKRMGWGRLRVWNDDEIGARSGFPPHPHADMEIITYVRTGAITHEDSMGNKGRTGAGDVQVMSAGTGVIPSSISKMKRPPFSRSGSRPTNRALNRPGASVSFPRTIARAASPSSPRAIRRTKPCRSTPTPRSWQPR